MEDFQKRMVEEHSQLVIRTNNLNNYIYSEQSDNDCKVEFANKCIQLAAMKKYEEALRARLENVGVIYEDGNYFQHIAKISEKPVNQEEENNNAE